MYFEEDMRKKQVQKPQHIYSNKNILSEYKKRFKKIKPRNFSRFYFT